MEEFNSIRLEGHAEKGVDISIRVCYPVQTGSNRYIKEKQIEERIARVMMEMKTDLNIFLD